MSLEKKYFIWALTSYYSIKSIAWNPLHLSSISVPGYKTTVEYIQQRISKDSYDIKDFIQIFSGAIK